jgi:lipopolysaccharide assembly outer membrane protein LptD (OstA)
MFFRPFAVGLAVVVATTAAAPHPPKTPPPQPGGGVETRNMTIVTDTTDANYNTGDFTMPHHVKFTRPGTTVVGDSARGNSKTDNVTITGHVVMNDNGNAPEARGAGAPAGGGPSQLTCNELQIDSKQKIYVATGDVHFTQGTRHGSADYGKLDQGAHTLELRGNVHLADGQSTFSGDYIRYDTLTKDVHTEGNPTQMTQPVNVPLPGKAPKPSPKPSPKPQ